MSTGPTFAQQDSADIVTKDLHGIGTSQQTQIQSFKQLAGASRSNNITLD
jgi:hypothetical protein